MLAGMHNPSLRRSVAGLALLPVFLLAVSAFGYGGLRCQLMGIVERCCCPQDEPAPPESTLAADHCCAEFHVTLQKAPTEAPRAVHQLVSTPVGEVTPAPVAAAARTAGRSVTAVAPFPRPPLLLVKQAFLI